MKRYIAVAVFLMAFLAVIPSHADEGMWLLSQLPKDYLKQHYNFDVTDDWVRHVQLSSARLPNCSSSFVSSDGLVMTNGHCAESAVEALSTPSNNLYEKGFYAKTYAQELKTDRTLRVLMTTSDVTKRVTDVVAENGSDLVAARQKVIADIQKTSSEASGLACEVVALYQGGQYHTYCYKLYKDVRLVFSSATNVWSFGGDADNFEYPRYTMDVAFFRAYENDKPASTPEHFRWSRAGAAEGELIFVAGHPGSTKRLLTATALKTERDVRAPFLLDVFRRRELTLQQFMLRGKEQRRIAQSDLFSWQNSRKLYAGKIRGLQDPRLLASKQLWEDKIFQDFKDEHEAADKVATGLAMIGSAQTQIRKDYVRIMLLNRGLGFDSRLYGYAQSLAAANQQAAKAVFEARAQEPPINREYEVAKLTDSLTHLVEFLGADDSLIAGLMRYGSGPADIAHKLVYGTALADVNAHRALVQGTTSTPDPMVNFAGFVRSQAEPYRGPYNKAVQEEANGYGYLSGGLFQGYGATGYPDATFTLRLSFGTIVGERQSGIPPFTTIGDAYRHAAEFDNAGDYKLPAEWSDRKKKVDLNTRLDFASNLDITGGNSGSPVFNRNREIVGIVFDGNLESLVSDYDYNYSARSRAVAVHSSGILEILKKIYRADRLVDELKRP